MATGNQSRIVKIQRPLSWVGDFPGYLIYDESREWQYIETRDEARPVMDGLLGDRLKGYFYATLNDQGEMQIGLDAPDQDW